MVIISSCSKYSTIQNIPDPIFINEEEMLGLEEGSKFSIKDLQKPVIKKPIAELDLSIKLTWPAKGTISSGYGLRQGKMHHGIDITKDNGKNIVAAAPGFVEFSGREKGFGNLIIIDHGNGIKTFYAHCSKLFALRNSKVKPGQLIARMGSTGKTIGPHLHFEIRIKGESKNPLKYLPVR